MSTKFNGRRYFQILGITMAVILVGLLCVMGYQFYSENYGLKQKGEGLETVSKEDGKINVLLLGLDQEKLRTDSIMVASYDVEEGQVKMLSIPRDTRMYIGARYQKINAAHALSDGNGGIKGALSSVEAVNRLTGIPIHYYLSFSFDAIKDCIDIVGPVTYEIPDLYHDGVGMVYDDPVQNLHINLKPGVQELNGEQVVHLLRYRKGNLDPKTKKRNGYLDGDRGRMDVLQGFMKAFVDQKLNASLILKIPAIFKQLDDNIETNLSVRDVAKYAKYLSGFSSTGISTFTLPGKDSGDEYTASYWICDLDETRQLIETEFGYDASGITIDQRSDAAAKAESGSKTDSAVKSTAKATATAKAAAKNTAAAKATQKPSAAQKNNGSKNEQTAKPDKSKTTAKATEKPESTKKPAKATEKPSSKDGKEDTKEEKEEAPKKTTTPTKVIDEEKESKEAA